ncbi:MAG TPA: Rne/Rng family ribonuclease [Acidobacteriaceae bacterium]|jgi:ribonuclease G|nr:Rne/Rng family ribonuclease [Acidobacteriaceae bacterium]
MSKEIYISSTPHETRLAIVEKDELSEIYYERENEYTLAGSIYNGRVTRVLPGMQSSFVDVGLERDAFLYITDFMEEQGDAADFDGGEGSRSEGRSRRSERNGERSDRGERGDRGEGGARRRGSRTPAAETVPEEGESLSLQGEAADGTEETNGEGSRRWRGRRGRRRGGRSENGEEQAAPVETGEAAAAADSGREYGRDVSRDAGRDSGRDAGRDSGRGSDRRHGDRRRRDESSGRQEAIRERFAPRGQRHTGADEGAEPSASAEPFILPGESLSKYRRGEARDGEERRTETEADRRSPAATAATRPSTEFDLPSAWDGGMTLPGESLSRYRGGDTRGGDAGEPNRPRAEGSSAGAGGRGRRRDRDEQRGRFGRGGERSLTPAEAVLPAVTSQHEPERAAEPLSDDVPAFEVAETEARLELEHRAAENVAYEPLTDVAAAEFETPVLEAVEEFHETIAEYEPGEEASASYRVNAAGQREFRQSGTVDETTEPVDAESVVEPRFAESHGFVGEAGAHEFTTVQPTGEMISEWPLTPEAGAVPEEIAQPAAPIAHEAAVQSVDLAHAEASPGLDERSPQAFAPGAGQLEEELLDEEDGEPATLHAAAEDYEEETLENAADLGTMLREMSIDSLTRGNAPGLDDDDDDEDEEDDDDFDISEEEMEEDELESDESIASSDIDEIEEEEAAEDAEFSSAESETDEAEGEPAGESSTEREPSRRPRRDGRDGRRGGRGREREREGRRSGMGSRSGGRSGRHSMQTTDLPAISDLLKPGQEVLVQIAKEPIAKKGARITSHIALPGRFLVFMPTVNHVGVSRKIESDGERRRLKEILLSEKGDASGGFIVRTAASGASEDELRSDLRFLLNLWADIKQRSESSKSPALIYHDLNLVERILRDQVTDNFSAIWVDTESEYERVLRFLQRFQPSLIRRVKLYSKETPLFEQFGIQEEINKALRSKVWLKSGGSIVINQTEALVAIDINTGKYVGKTARLEDTIVKTNLDAIAEIVRQIRLRDLGGIIVIDFIDMDERRNRQKVLIALEEELKKDRAPSKVLQFNDFGLVAITRKRVKQSLERTLSTTCSICTGTGMVKSPVTVCNEIFIELRKMHRHLEKGDIMLRVHPEVVKQLKSGSGKWLQEMEEMSRKTILVKSDPSLHPEQFDIH